MPAMFSSPVLGSQFLLQDKEEKPVEGSSFEKDRDGSNSGELVLVAPTVGLSTTLLNRDHYTEYYEGMPSGPDGELLRRHGDEVEYVRSSLHLSEENQNSTTPYFRALGRSDDTMNIGGKKKIFCMTDDCIHFCATFSWLTIFLSARYQSWKCRN